MIISSFWVYPFHSFCVDVNTTEDVSNCHPDRYHERPHRRKHHLVTNLLEQLLHFSLYIFDLTATLTGNL